MLKPTKFTQPKTDDDLPALLYSRQQVARMLGNIHVSFVRRLEKSGQLRGIRLSRSATGMVFFRAEDVRRLVATADE